MSFQSLASIKLSDLLNEVPAGEPVNVHVVRLPSEPEQDFAQMKQIIGGSPATHKDKLDKAAIPLPKG
jgi:hypothetical protein